MLQYTGNALFVKNNNPNTSTCETNLNSTKINDLNNNLPYFSPFRFLDKSNILDPTDMDELSDLLKANCEILNSYKYYDLDNYRNINKKYTFRQ